jgi:spore germination cell wall hydrolase CwlJ-like protein
MNFCKMAPVLALVGVVLGGGGMAAADAVWHASYHPGDRTADLGSDWQGLEGQLPKLVRIPAPDLTVVLPAAAQTKGLTEDWLMAQPAPEGDAEWQCLTEALYFEARGESLQGQVAVAEVILNRVNSPLYPRTICKVVKQRGGGGCQFSYVCDGRADRMRDKTSADLAGRIARAMLDGAPRRLTEGATHFHSRGVKPGWSKRFAHTTTIGAHAFYRQPG